MRVLAGKHFGGGGTGQRARKSRFPRTRTNEPARKLKIYISVISTFTAAIVYFYTINRDIAGKWLSCNPLKYYLRKGLILVSNIPVTFYQLIRVIYQVFTSLFFPPSHDDYFASWQLVSAKYLATLRYSRVVNHQEEFFCYWFIYAVIYDNDDDDDDNDEDDDDDDDDDDDEDDDDGDGDGDDDGDDDDGDGDDDGDDDDDDGDDDEDDDDDDDDDEDEDDDDGDDDDDDGDDDYSYYYYRYYYMFSPWGGGRLCMYKVGQKISNYKWRIV